MNVYDFDNTIYHGESGVDAFFFYLKRHPQLLLALPWGIHAVARYKRGSLSIDDAIAQYSGTIEAFCRKHITDPDGDVKRFWDTHMHKIKPFYLAQRKPDDVILSASMDIFLAEICRRLGIGTFIGSVTDVERMRMISFCYRENKVAAFRAAFPDAVVENFYTDSLNDTPMIELAQNAFLVKGDVVTKIK
ncbi:MAG: haloacid dehalogenase-like hydrolase [Clostridia bacterium]|nr:haloacid dehalogenase-like hydrolase [Clostridia bacterium]